MNKVIVFPQDELARLRIENQIMMKALRKIQDKPLFPDNSLLLYEYQSCRSTAEETIEDIEGD